MTGDIIIGALAWFAAAAIAAPFTGRLLHHRAAEQFGEDSPKYAPGLAEYLAQAEREDPTHWERLERDMRGQP